MTHSFSIGLVRLIIFGCLLLAGTARAQAPAWQWAVTQTGSQECFGYATAIDGGGNVIVAGSFRDTVAFGATTLIGAGGPDVFVAKLSPTGQWLWATTAGGTSVEEALSVAVDSSGNVYVAGDYASEATFGDTTLIGPGSYDVFVAKLSPDGRWLWAASAGSAGEDRAYDVVVDRQTNVYVTGEVGYGWNSDTATFGSTTLATQGNGDVFVAKLSAAGQWLWVASGGGAGTESSSALDIDASGNLYITGVYDTTAVTFGATTLPRARFYNLFVAKLSTGGQWLWATEAGGSVFCGGRGVAVDQGGNVYLTGYFGDLPATFGTTTLTCAGRIDAFVAKLSPTGQWLWAIGAGTPHDDEGYALAVDGSGNVCVTGSYYAFPIQFGATTLPAANFRDVFVATLSPGGQWLWATNAGGYDYDLVNGLALDQNGAVCITGAFSGPTTHFGPISLALSSQNGYSFYIARLAGVTGLVDEATSSGFRLAPNPAHHTVQLTGASASAVELIDALGRSVRTALSAASELTLDLTGLPAGLYVVRCGGQTQRLVVE